MTGTVLFTNVPAGQYPLMIAVPDVTPLNPRYVLLLGLVYVKADTDVLSVVSLEDAYIAITLPIWPKLSYVKYGLGVTDATSVPTTLGEEQVAVPGDPALPPSAGEENGQLTANALVVGPDVAVPLHETKSVSTAAGT